jgi:hypothetical protein
MVTNKFFVTPFCITYKSLYTSATDNNQPVRVCTVYCMNMKTVIVAVIRWADVDIKLIHFQSKA